MSIKYGLVYTHRLNPGQSGGFVPQTLPACMRCAQRVIQEYPVPVGQVPTTVTVGAVLVHPYTYIWGIGVRSLKRFPKTGNPRTHKL